MKIFFSLFLLSLSPPTAGIFITQPVWSAPLVPSLQCPRSGMKKSLLHFHSCFVFFFFYLFIYYYFVLTRSIKRESGREWLYRPSKIIELVISASFQVNPRDTLPLFSLSCVNQLARSRDTRKYMRAGRAGQSITNNCSVDKIWHFFAPLTDGSFNRFRFNFHRRVAFNFYCFQLSFYST